MRSARGGRRAFIAAALCSAASGLALAQRVYRLGILASRREAWDEDRAVTKELAAQGLVEDRNLVLVERYLQEDPGKIEPFVAQLVAAKPDAILTRGTPLTRAVLEATHTIPVVTSVWDPVESGFAKSLTASGRNVTGLGFGATAVAMKTLDVARALVPGAKRLVVFVHPSIQDTHLPPFERAATAASMAFEPFAGTREGVQEWIRAFRPRGDTVAYVHGYVDTERATQLAIERRLPLFGGSLEGVRAGQLAVYVQYIRDEEKRFAQVIAAVLRGSDPSKIPFEMPDSEALAINRSTARKLGLTIPDALLLKVNALVD